MAPEPKEKNPLEKINGERLIVLMKKRFKLGSIPGIRLHLGKHQYQAPVIDWPLDRKTRTKERRRHAQILLGLGGVYFPAVAYHG